MAKPTRLLAALLTLVLVAASCGDDDGSAQPAPAEPAPAEPEAEPEPAEPETEPEPAEPETEPGSDSSEGEDGPDQEGAGLAVDPGATIPARTCDEPGTVRIGVWDEALAPIVQDASAQWVADYCPGAEAVVEVTPWNDYWEALQIAAGGGGDIPDVLWMSPVFMPFYYEVGVVQNMQGLLEAGGVDTAVWGALAAPFTFEGDVYGAPINWDTVAVVANTDLLDQAGVDVPAEGWTWDDYAAAGEAVAGLGDDIFGVAGHGGYQNGYGGFLASAGVAPVLSNDRTRCTLSDPASLATFEFFVDLVDRGIAPTPDDAGGPSGNDYFNLFMSGRLGMTTMGSWTLVTLLESVDFNVALLPMPAHPDTGQSVAISNAIAYTISSSADNPVLAANLVQYLSSDEGSQFWIEGQGFAPANPAPALQEGWLAGFAGSPVDATVFVDALVGSQSITVYGLDMWNAVNGELETRIFTNGESVVDAAAAICKTVEAGLSS